MSRTPDVRESEEMRAARHRLATIVWEQLGPEPPMSLDELLTTLERRLWETRQRYNAERARAEKADAALNSESAKAMASDAGLAEEQRQHEQTRAEWRAERVRAARAEAEVERVRKLISDDGSALAAALGKVRDTARGYDWICEGRGPYTYDDDRYRMEVGSLITQVISTAEEALRASGRRIQEAFHPRAQATAQMFVEDCVREEEAKPVEHFGTALSQRQWKRLSERFGVGPCGCDGAVDNGCPLCTEERFREWLEGAGKEAGRG